MNINSGDLKDRFILCIWVIGLLVFISLFWFSTQNVQTKYLLRAINDVFISREDSRRVSSSLPLKTKNLNLMGFRYKIYNSSDSLYVFTIFQDGILIPAGAVVTNEGLVDEIIPLSAHAKTVFEKIPDSVIQTYIKRIEAGEK